MSDWRYVCEVSTIADQEPQEVEVEGKKIVVVKCGDEIYACPAMCPHMDEPLSLGYCTGRTLVCSFHSWEWDLQTGKAQANAQLDLQVYPTKVDAGRLYVQI